ncbi:MAG: hypothetical protein NZ602_07435 [Thermoguttaceae bacterium]|nr:hypothetical protein [Thermoguttaceae bacterium]MDW8037758.1 vWA domain-containing protein [Thermoguttaceae bacterium]
MKRFLWQKLILANLLLGLWSSPLWAQQEATRIHFEWGRIQSNADWILPVAACVLFLLYVRLMYQKDSQELPGWLGWLLTAFRSIVFLALLILYLDPTWRTERELVHPSRVALLVDTSLSMATTDVNLPGTSLTASRSQLVQYGLEQTPLLEQLRRTHQVSIWRFDQEVKRLLELDRLGKSGSKEPSDDQLGTDQSASSGQEPSSSENPAQANGSPEASRIAWDQLLRPVGQETHLGTALRQVLIEERAMPLAGVILISDGGHNAGPAPETALPLAQEAKVPIFAIGIGSDKKPSNVRVVDLLAPARAYPGDRLTITAYLQAEQFAKREVVVELLARQATAGGMKAMGTGQREDSQRVILGADGEMTPVKFEIPTPEPGRRIYCVRVQPPAGDTDATDNFREAEVEIVERKNKVLLVAGGPTREYQFLRNLLYRDKSTMVDIYLQTGQPGISQEANQILDDFPILRQELYQYDCIVAFDPDWNKIGPQGAEVLESWVAEQGGGLILVAGPVHMGEAVGGWIENPQLAKIRSLYPVEFHRQLSISSPTEYASEQPWPLEFTRAGLEAQYLWLEESASASQSAWQRFPGVYSFFPVRGVKPGATVLARFSDPRSGQGGEGAPYFVTQFYGSGRVFYMGSGEMWRLRAVEEKYFEIFYTKLIRHVSQGRLLRGSPRGVLLVGQEQYQLGNIVEVRAQLTNAQMQPLEAPSVQAQLLHVETGSVQNLTLIADSSRPGMFAGQFTPTEEGTYRVELLVPDSADERLVQTIRVRMPKLESQTPQRRDDLLSRLTQGVEGGQYYLSFEEALQGTAGKPSLLSLLQDKTRTTVLLDAPNRPQKEQWLQVILAVLCGCLFLEWTIRRLVRLA